MIYAKLKIIMINLSDKEEYSNTVESVYNELCYNVMDLITIKKKKLSDSCIKMC
jgi:hypothetical protein